MAGWEPAPPLDAVPYNLFAAGVRRIHFVLGVTEEELKGLCEVAMIDPVRDLNPEGAMALSALCSCQKPTTELTISSVNIMEKSSQC